MTVIRQVFFRPPRAPRRIVFALEPRNVPPLSITGVTQEPDAVRRAGSESVKGPGVEWKAGVRPKKLSLAGVVAENQDVLAGAENSVEEARWCAVVGANRAPGREPAFIDACEVKANRLSLARQSSGFSPLHFGAAGSFSRA